MFSPEIKNLIKEEFAALDKVIYLDTSLCAIPPKSVIAAYTGFVDEFAATSGTGIPFQQRMEEARENMAKILHCSVDEVGFCENTTEAMGTFAAGFPWEKDDEMVVATCEHQANCYAYIVQSKKKGFKINWVEPGAGGLMADQLIAACTPKTRVLAVSSAQSADGGRVDLQKLGDFCKEKGIYLVVDGIQSLGRLDVDVKKLNISWLGATAHKGLLCYTGCGVLYCDEKLLPLMTPPLPTYYDIERPSDMSDPEDMNKIHFLPGARRFDTQDAEYYGIHALRASSDLLCRIGIKDIEEHILRLQERLTEKAGVKFLGDLPSGVIVEKFAPEKKEAIAAIMEKYNIRCSVRDGNFRMCISFYNTEEQMDIAAKAILEARQV